jgi:hypothetical protein
MAGSVTATLFRFAACCFLLAGTSALAADPFPAQLSVTFLARPAPLVQYGATRLVYEMLITNFSRHSYAVESIEAKAGETTSKFDGAALEPMFLYLGTEGPPDKTQRTVEAGRSVIVFLMLDLGKKKAPAAIAHSLRVRDDKGDPHEVTPAPLAVADETPIVVAPPLRGEWIAGDSVTNLADAAHRRAVLIENGQAWLAQRYAIDWVQIQTIDGEHTTWKGPEDKNESYFCYGKPIYSVAAGTVVGMSDNLADNVPHSGKHVVAINADNAAGNHAVVEIAPHRYVLYAHMRPGTVRVKTGDRVRVGDIIGRVGNTGSSEEPHLHMHIDDQPSFLGGNGVPYEFTRGDASGPVEANVSSPTAVHFGPIGPQRPFVNDYPAANALVTFK